ncbi:hypothetical protein PI27_gp028 [Listeria phage WIL-1]|nr:hypothetical protein PI27_gp028 [Listeria phage WIL-1]
MTDWMEDKVAPYQESSLAVTEYIDARSS